jgi:hypothetical protein
MTTVLEVGIASGSRNAAQRAKIETLLRRADSLPPGPQALMQAYLDRGMSVRELAAMNGITPREMRYRLERLRSALADPCFQLVARYGETLPRNLWPLVRAYWLEGRTMRELAAQRRQSLHRIRQQVSVARSLLLVALSSENARAKARAHEALCEGLPSKDE